MNEDKMIWFFKEPRSGSSWLSHVLKHKLARTAIHIDKPCHWLARDGIPLIGQVSSEKIVQELQSYTDVHAFYGTHRFELLTELGVYRAPVIIRSIRRTIVEQVLSEMTVDISGWRVTHRHRDPDRDALSANMFKILIKNPVAVLKQSLVKYMQKIKQRDELWNEYSRNYQNHTIVYEDLAQGVSLPVYSGTIKFGDYDDFIVKTPDYKKDLFVNYDQIVGWIDEYAESMSIDRKNIVSA